MRVLGRYELLKRIGVGGMGEVFLARPAGGRVPLVVKILLPELVENSQALEMFLDEARITAHLDHPNISRILDLGRVGGSFFLAAEYVHGVDAGSLLRTLGASGLRLPVQLAAWIASEAAAGLDYAHHARHRDGRPLCLIHRDVSPPNLMLGFDGRVKLIDFGVAKATDRLVRTATGKLKGKVPYMSPEQARGEELDQRSDIFSLGIVLIELATSTRLFRRKNEIAALQAVLEEPVPRPSSLNPDVDASLEAIILRALERDPARRFQTAGELCAAVRRWLDALPPTYAAADLGALLADLFPSRLDLDDPTAITEQSRPPKEPTATTVPGARRRFVPLGAEGLGGTVTEKVPDPPYLAATPAPRRRPVLLVVLAALAGGIVAAGLTLFVARTTPIVQTQAFQPTLSITSTPDGALVELDGEEIGRTPLQAYRLVPSKPSKVTISLPGYRTLERELTGAESVSLELALTREHAASD